MSLLLVAVPRISFFLLAFSHGAHVLRSCTRADVCSHPSLSLFFSAAVWNREKVSSNQLFGRTSIRLSEVLPPASAKEGWFELYDGESGKKNFNIMHLNGSPADHYIALVLFPSSLVHNVALWGWSRTWCSDGRPPFGALLPQYDYNPRCKQELLMRQDDIIILLEEDKDWALVENAISASQG
jgi:hypothetical protein